MGLHVTLRIGRFPAQIPLMRLVRLWDLTSFQGSWWPSDRTWNSVVINIRWVKLSPCQWPKVETADKKKFEQTLHLVSVFLLHFYKQANVRCSIGSISRPIPSRDHNTTNQEIARDRCQSYFRKLGNFFSGKQEGAGRTDQKTYSLLIYDFCMTVGIFKVATSLSKFSTTLPSLAL